MSSDRPGWRSADAAGSTRAVPATTLAEMREIIARYPQPRSALLPMLHLVQASRATSRPTASRSCAEILGISTAEVSGGRDVLHDVQASPGRRLPRRRLHQHAVRGDGRRRDLRAAQGPPRRRQRRDHRDGNVITLEHVECNAACDYAPVVMVNWEFFDNQTPESATQLVDDLRAGEEVTLHPRRHASAPGARPSGCSPASRTAGPTRARRRPGLAGRARARARERLDRAVSSDAAGPHRLAGGHQDARPRTTRTPTARAPRPSSSESDAETKRRGRRRRAEPQGRSLTHGRHLTPVLSATGTPTACTLEGYERHGGYQALDTALGDGRGRPHRSWSRTPGCAAAAAPASRPA